MADSLFQQAEIHFSQQDSFALFRELNEALQISIKLCDSANISDMLNSHGYYHYFYGNYRRSLTYYQQALAIDKVIQDTVKMIGRLYNIGEAHNKLGLFVNALENLQQALRLAEAINRTKSLAMVSNSIGGLFSNNYQNVRALEYYHQSLFYYFKIPDSLGAAYVLNNLGMLFQKQGNYDSASFYYQKALAYKESVADERSSAITKTNLGELCFLLDSLDRAETYLLSALNTFNQREDTYRQAWAGNKLVTLYLIQKKYSLVRAYLDSIKHHLVELDARQERLTYLENEAIWQEANGKAEVALDFHKQWASLRDSLFNEDRLKVTQMQAAYELKQEEQAKLLAQQQTQLAQKETRKQKTRVIAIALVLGIFIGLALILYQLFRKNERLSHKNELLVREQHHRVKNNLQVLSSMLNMQSRRMQEKNAKNAMTESQLRVQAMSLIHRRLYGTQLSQISMKNYMEELIQEIISCFGCSPLLDMKIADVVLDIKQAVPIGLIVNEVVSNACKYAFPDHANPQLKVRLCSADEKHYQLSLQDNGPGLESPGLETPDLFQTERPSEGMDQRKSFGMELIHLQADQIRAKVSFENQQGTLFILKFTKQATL